MKNPVALSLAAALSLPLSACATAPLETAAPPVSGEARLADVGERIIRHWVSYDPTAAYSLGISTADHRSWPDRSPEALARVERQNERHLAEVEAIDPKSLSGRSAQTRRAVLIESLRSNQQLQVCRSELWANVSHMTGWHLGLVGVAREQPVRTPEERAQALERWSLLPQRAAQEIANARLGLAQGYSAPKPVVLKVLKQVAGLVQAPPEKSPFYSPAERSEDAAFRAAYADVLARPVREALKAYHDFLRNEYLPKARETLGISAHPNGAECYRASLRRYTTLDRAPEEVFRLGQEAVGRNTEFVRDLGRQKFGTSDLQAIIKRINEAPDNRFDSEQALISFSRDVVARARVKSAPLFVSMPSQEMRVEPFLPFQRGSGAFSHYQRDMDPTKPAFFRINSEIWASETRGGAEVTAIHEGYPGHHMQVAFANSLRGGPVATLGSNSAYAEGWARYAEMLGEEAGMYETPYALMTRRLWPARGMVADPGLHVFGWSRERVIAYLRESGRFAGAELDDLVDRMASVPGQLTAYDSGGLEIMALRREAERALGRRFDIKQFHQRILENGSVPLSVLQANVRNWIAEARRGG